ncbi:MAG: esterase, partial [Deltaproteobacteria bacterium]|nr:esterase [Deltaproteobacteria bacterium]
MIHFKDKYSGAVIVFVTVSLLVLFSCAHTARQAGHTFSHDGLGRRYILYQPAFKTGHSGARPLLMVLHGGGGTNRGMLRLTKERFNELADRDGFFVVYPQGIDKSWNDGRPDKISGAHRKGIDDVGFFRALIDHLIAHYPIDSKRIFVTGISNGGLMSYQLSCSLPDKIRAIAPVTAQIPAAIAPLCDFESTVSLAVFNGTEDPLVPYNGGQITVFRWQRGAVLSTDETIRIWRRKNRCRPKPLITEMPDIVTDGTRVTKIEYSRCSNESKVVLYRIEGGGHTWPDGRQYLPV